MQTVWPGTIHVTYLMTRPMEPAANEASSAATRDRFRNPGPAKVRLADRWTRAKFDCRRVRTDSQHEHEVVPKDGLQAGHPIDDGRENERLEDGEGHVGEHLGCGSDRTRIVGRKRATSGRNVRSSGMAVADRTGKP